MSTALLIKSAMGLIAILAVLFFLFFLSFRSKKKVKKKLAIKKKEETKSITSFDYLKSIIKDKESTTSQLKDALNLIILHHGTIAKRRGSKVASDFDGYMEIIFKLCRHKNTNKDLIVSFTLDLEKKNPEFVKEISITLSKGLNSITY